MNIEKINKAVKPDLKERLKEVVPSVFEDGKINFEKLKALLNLNLLSIKPAIIEKEVFDKVQEILGENKKTFTSPSQNKYNLLLRGLVRCGYCGSVMSSHYSIKNGQKYFYYKCTRVMHRNKKACPSKPLSAREFENAIVEKIKELSQDRSQLEETLKNANLVAQKELEPLREKKILLEKAKREKEEEIKRLIKAIKVGSLEIEAIEEELKI